MSKTIVGYIIKSGNISPDGRIGSKTVPNYSTLWRCNYIYHERKTDELYFEVAKINVGEFEKSYWYNKPVFREQYEFEKYLQENYDYWL